MVIIRNTKTDLIWIIIIAIIIDIVLKIITIKEIKGIKIIIKEIGILITEISIVIALTTIIIINSPYRENNCNYN